MLEMKNRRYIGSKQKLLDRIYEIISQLSIDDENIVFADIFSGTGVVAEKFIQNGYEIIVNDMLKQNVLSYKTWLSDENYDSKKIESLIEKYNEIDPKGIEENYFSNIYGGKYFSVNDSKLIGHIREDIENKSKELNDREYSIILTSLIYSVDKIANTVGHFEHYLSKGLVDKGLNMRFPLIKDYDNKAWIFNEDSNNLVKKIKCDIAYIDPPYNARQYINFYHVLENLANWDKPTEFEGKSMKFKRDHLKSDYSKSKAPQVFEDLIKNIDSKYIIVSYNNTYSANSNASNNKISEDEIKSILKRKGSLVIHELDHKHFNSGKTNFKEHKEYLYVCEVKNDTREI